MYYSLDGGEYRPLGTLTEEMIKAAVGPEKRIWASFPAALADIQARQIQVKFVNRGPDLFVIWETYWVGGDVEPGGVQLLSAASKVALDDMGTEHDSQQGQIPSRTPGTEGGEESVGNLVGQCWWRAF